MASHDIVVLVHIKVQFKVFDDVNGQSHYLFFLNDLSSGLHLVFNDFWLLSGHKRLQIELSLLQVFYFCIDSGYLSFCHRLIVWIFLSKQKFEFIVTCLDVTLEILLKRRSFDHHLSCGKRRLQSRSWRTVLHIFCFCSKKGTINRAVISLSIRRHHFLSTSQGRLCWVLDGLYNGSQSWLVNDAIVHRICRLCERVVEDEGSTWFSACRDAGLVHFVSSDVFIELVVELSFEFLLNIDCAFHDGYVWDWSVVSGDTVLVGELRGLLLSSQHAY